MIIQKYVTVREIAELLSASTKTIYQWAELRQIPCFKVNGCLRFDLDEVIAWIKACKIGACSGMTSEGSKKLRTSRE